MSNPVWTRLGWRLEAVAATCCGSSHARNEDALLVSPDNGLFAVADGMGGHRDAHLASEALVSRLERTPLDGIPLEAKIERTALAILGVNEALYRESLGDPEGDICGSTIVALVAHAGHACCLWAGDSRLYLFRDAHLYLVSEDHAAPDGALTRAVGSCDQLTLGRRLIETRPGDLFLLCSDGLSKGIGDDDLADILACPGEGLTDRLVERALAGGSVDDITLIVVRIAPYDPERN